jgi:beta-phosphoglucomutase-like phosphatase (HAD superfamily)
MVVIVDSYDGHYHAWQQIFNELGHHLTKTSFSRTFGMNNRLILYTILKPASCPMRISR